MVRALIAGVGGFPERHVTEEDIAGGTTRLGPLPAVGPAVRNLAFALERSGAGIGEGLLLECDEPTFTAHWTALHQGGREPLIVHLAGHGVRSSRQRLYFAAAGAGSGSRRSPTDGCISITRLLEEAEESGRAVLLVLDLCGAGQAIALQQFADLAAGALQDAPRQVWVIAACADDKITYGARFTTATAEVLHRLADGDLDINPALTHIPVTTLAAAIDQHLARADAAAGRPRQYVVHSPTALADNTGHPPFLPNPTHTPHPLAALLGTVNPLLRDFPLGCAPGLDPLHFATRAAGNPTATAVHFSGRHSQLARIEHWINGADGSRPEGRAGAARNGMLVVTGGPGSGKSSLLGVAACVTHPDLEALGDLITTAVTHFNPRQPEIVLAVHARQLSIQQITDSLYRQLHEQAPHLAPDHRSTVGRHAHTPHATQAPSHDTDPVGRALATPPPTNLTELLSALRTAADVLVIVDALDEAVDPQAVCRQFLLPLARMTDNATSNCRVIIGTRPWWDTFHGLRSYLDLHPERELDLDPAAPEDRRILADDLHLYLSKRLRRLPREETRRIAVRLAQQADSGAFLVASLYADHLRTAAAGTGKRPVVVGDLPTTITEVFDLHSRALAVGDPWVTSVLAAIGQARGDGMPLDLLHLVALAHRPPTCGQAAPQPADTRRALRKAAFYLRTTSGPDQKVLYRYFHQALADHTAPRTDPIATYEALLATVPTTADGDPDWERADRCLLRHAADYAHAAGGGRLDRLMEDPGFLVHSDPDTLTPCLHHATTDLARLHAHVYRTSTPTHPHRHDRVARRDLLSLAAVAWRQPSLAARLAQVTIRSAPLPATPLWATSSTAHPARRHVLTGHATEITAVATLTGPNGPFAVTADWDGAAIVWNPMTGQRLHTLTGHTEAIITVDMLTGPNGTPIAFTTDRNGTAIVWNPATGKRLHKLAGRIGPAAVMTTPNGTALAIAGRDDHAAIIWNLATGEQLQCLTGHATWTTAVALTTRPDGTALAVTGSQDGTAIVWDVETGQCLHTLTSRPDVLAGLGRRRDPDERLLTTINKITTVAGPDGTPLVITGNLASTLTVWNPLTGERIHTLEDHSSADDALAIMPGPGGRALAVTLARGGGRATVWDVASARHLHDLDTDAAVRLAAVAVVAGQDGTHLAITIDAVGTASVWNPTTGELLSTFTGHTNRVNAVATLHEPDGAPLVVTASGRTAVVWDPASTDRLHPRGGHLAAVSAVAVLPSSDGRPRAVSASHDQMVMWWDLETGDRLGTPVEEDEAITSLALVAGPDDTRLAVTADSHRPVATVWDLVTGERLHTLTGHAGWVSAVAAVTRSDGVPVAVTTSEDGTAAVWDLVAGERLHILAGHTGWVSAVAAVTRSDGVPVAVTTSEDGTAVVWDLVAGERLHTLTGHTGWVSAVAAVTRSDGVPVAVTTSEDGTAVVWDLVTGERLHTLTGHTGPVLAVAAVIAPAGALRAVTTGEDGTAIVWDLHTGRLLRRCFLPQPSRQVAATEQGFLIGFGPDVAHIAHDHSQE